jgi:RNA polymerase subunit RPABC4/transcription elongation factor Spt4
VMQLIVVVLQVALAIFGAYMLALWLAMVFWTYHDIRARTQDIYVQVFGLALVLAFNVLGLLLYLILRPKETIAEAYERSLEEEAILQDLEERAHCPNCRQRVEKDFVVCPICQTGLKQQCLHCQRLLELDWTVCPYCVHPAPSMVTGEAEGDLVPATSALRPRV